MDCRKCKSFGPTHLHSLLEPITRRHPFKLIITNTLSMPKGKGGFTKIGLWVDVYSQHVWGDKLKKPATGASTVKKFENICTTFTVPEALMTDGGPEFNNATGMNGKLLGRLKRLCAPDLGEDKYKKMGKMDIPSNWPDDFDDALEYLNTRILPHLKFTPNELLLGLVINTTRTPETLASEEPTPADIAVQMAYMDQLRLDGYAAIVEHAGKRKAEFNRKVTARAPKEVIFKAGQLVQVGHKMEPKWSALRRVVGRDRNSYKLETLEGLLIGGRFSSRCLRRFIPRVGTQLHELQEAIEKTRGEEKEKADRVEVVAMGAEGNGANTFFKDTELVEGHEGPGSHPLDSSGVE
ncbi:hypothetical protein DXG01_001186 [Tephrocybe rancida]|nr:hypothetical protein DXG01_001186 [Tephrocybe rancida]